MVDYDPASSTPTQTLPFEDLPSTNTPIRAAWLNHLDAVMDDIAGPSGRIADLEAGGGGGGGSSTTVTANTQTGTSYTLVIGDAGKVIEMNNASANTCTVPPNASVAFDTGTVLEVAQIGAGQTTIVADTGVTIRTPSTLLLRAQYSTVALRKRGTNEWVLAGDVE